MNKKLAVLLSMRITFIEKTLAFLGLREELEQFRSEVKEAGRLVIEVLDVWEEKLFDNPKMLELPLDEQIHPLLKELVE